MAGKRCVCLPPDMWSARATDTSTSPLQLCFVGIGEEHLLSIDFVAPTTMAGMAKRASDQLTFKVVHSTRANHT